MGNCVSSEDSSKFVNGGGGGNGKDPFNVDNGRSSNSKLENSFRGSGSSQGASNKVGAVNDVNGKGQALSASSSVSSKHSNKIVIALYNYFANDEGDLSFRKGDRLQIIDDTDPDWWLAKHLASNQKGYIPMNYVVSEVIEMEE